MVVWIEAARRRVYGLLARLAIMVGLRPHPAGVGQKFAHHYLTQVMAINLWLPLFQSPAKRGGARTKQRGSGWPLSSLAQLSLLPCARRGIGYRHQVHRIQVDPRHNKFWTHFSNSSRPIQVSGTT